MTTRTLTRTFCPADPGQLLPAQVEAVFDRCMELRAELAGCAWSLRWHWNEPVHLAAHPGCKRRWRAYRRLRATLTGLPVTEVAP